VQKGQQQGLEPEGRQWKFFCSHFLYWGRNEGVASNWKSRCCLDK